ncbi:hypothetical protein BGX26_003963, partial [Mortierella sp. AD094]
MYNETSREQDWQAFRICSTSRTLHIQTHLDKGTGQHIVLWNDILLLYKDAKYVINGNGLVSFIRGDDFEYLTPLRIEHHPDTILEVVLEGMDNSTNTIYERTSATSTSPTNQESIINPLQAGMAKINVTLPLVGESTSEATPENSDNQSNDAGVAPSSKDLVSHSTSMTPRSRNSLQAVGQLYNSYMQAMTNGHATLAMTIKTDMTQHFDNLQVEMEKNKSLQHQIIQMQHQMEIKQQQVLSMQHLMEEKQKEMLHMQKQTLDRLAIIQSRVQALLTQTYELHEYPIPRLFIILPNPASRKNFGRLFSDQFKLFFLCECGKHTMAEGSTITHEIHLAKHEGYDIAKPNEFFKKYGSYILTLMQMFKYGAAAAGVVVPSLEKFEIVEGMGNIQKYLHLAANDTMRALVDDAISFLEEQQRSFTNSIETSGHARFDGLEVLEGAELRQLESYLRVKDEGRVLGNLYRIVTTEGHVKWVCIDHYRATYREKAIQDLMDIVKANGGFFIGETGKINIQIVSSTLADQFYDAIIKARSIQELNIQLKWDVTFEDLKKFADAITKANVYNLTVTGYEWKGPAFDLINRTRRYDPIIQMASNGRIQSLVLKDFENFFKRVSISATMAQQLRKLEIGEPIKLEDKSSRSIFSGILDNCPCLTELQLNTRQLKPLIEFIVDKLGHLQLAEATYLHFDGTSGALDTTLRFDSRSVIPWTKMAPSSENKTHTTRSKVTQKDFHTSLKVGVSSLFDRNCAEDLFSLYSKYNWSIKDLKVQNIGGQLRDGFAKFLDQLTVKRALYRTFLSTLRTSDFTTDDLQSLENVIRRSQRIGRLSVYFDDTDVKTVQEKLRYFQGPMGEKMSELIFSGKPTTLCVPDLESTLPRHSFPMLEFFECISDGEISKDWARYITAAVTGSSQTTHTIDDTSSSRTLRTSDIPTVKTRKSLRIFRFSGGKLQSEDWTRVIKALDLSKLEVIGLQSCNFSLEQLEIFIDCIMGVIENDST